MGLGLRISDLPEVYRFRDQVITWESQFWRRPVAQGLFAAAIDTTFALYRGRGEFALMPSLRTGWPFLARHEPWYCDSDNPSDEQRFYDESTKVHAIHWSGDRQPDWLPAAVIGMQASEKKLLHLGCGPNIIGGWTNLDEHDNVGVDLIFDLDSCASAKLPLEDNTVDGFFSGRGFAAIENIFETMQELYRVAKPGAKFILRLPYGACDDSAVSPPQRAYVPDDFRLFAQPGLSRVDRDYGGDWDLVRVRLVVRSETLQSENAMAALKRVAAEPSLVDEMIVEKAIKPSRPRDPNLLQTVTPVLSAEHLDPDTQF